ncbi:MAG: hypothetical protein AAFO82_15740 [Bacteroidota bacterium]
MSKSQAYIFIKQRRNSNARKLFLKIIDYVVFCYNNILQDQITYSKKYCLENTAYHLEDYLKIRLVVDYLQKRDNKLNCSYPNEILELEFNYETEKEYMQEGKLKSDKIDVIVSNLNLNNQWNDIERENLYFVFECKRLLNKSKSNLYLSDIEKFVQREYTAFRFPFNGLIGFVEKSTFSINEIIEDIDHKLQKHELINSVSKNDEELIMQPYQINHFKNGRISKHLHINKGDIEVFHLFFDYSAIIVD